VSEGGGVSEVVEASGVPEASELPAVSVDESVGHDGSDDGSVVAVEQDPLGAGVRVTCTELPSAPLLAGPPSP
jgi:hypothetical protein